MRVMQVRNVEEALASGMLLLERHGQTEDSRAGPVIVAPWPVTTVTERPTERVLHAPERDANPFFHLAEAAWMLAGRDDAEFVNRYVGNFGRRYAEDNGRVHGAYGARWRRALGFDQIEHVVETLRRDPTSRQCVMQMWDATPQYDDLRGSWRDRPCNTHVYLRVRGPRELRHWSTRTGSRVLDCVTTLDHPGRHLDLTVCCRSNDAVWGAHGANAVHFSVLQEYLAGRIGAMVGTMTQVSNNYHAYTEEYEKLRGRCEGDFRRLNTRWYERHDDEHVPVVQDPSTIDREIHVYCEHPDIGVFANNSFVRSVLIPAALAHAAHKRGDHGEVTRQILLVGAADWRHACAAWIARRRETRERKQREATT